MTGSTAPFIVIDDRHLVERDAVEQDLHVLERVDRHARLADVADDARMVAVIAAVGGEIEGDRQALLPGGEVAAVEGVRILGGREAGILADRPRPAGVHRGIGPARERREAGQAGVERRRRPRPCRAAGRRCPRACARSRSLPFTSLAAAASQSALVGFLSVIPRSSRRAERSRGSPALMPASPLAMSERAQCASFGVSINSTSTPPMSFGWTKITSVPCAPIRGSPSTFAPFASISALASWMSGTSKQT